MVTIVVYQKSSIITTNMTTATTMVGSITFIEKKSVRVRNVFVL